MLFFTKIMLSVQFSARKSGIPKKSGNKFKIFFHFSHLECRVSTFLWKLGFESGEKNIWTGVSRVPPLDHSVQSQNEKSNLPLTCRFKIWRENPENFRNLTVWQVVWKFKWSIRSTKIHFWRINFINLMINTITQNNSNLFQSERIMIYSALIIS